MRADRAVTTASTTASVHANKIIQDVKYYASALNLDANDPLLIPTLGFFLPGGATPR